MRPGRPVALFLNRRPRKTGFRSAFALPLRLRDMIIGPMNLFHAEQSPMDERDVIVARAFADRATISVLQHRAVTETQRVKKQLSGALASRVVIEQAKGVISERAWVDLARAFNRLRNYARNDNLRLTDVAQAVVDHTLELT